MNNRRHRRNFPSMIDLLRNSSSSSSITSSQIMDLMNDYNNNIRDMIHLLERCEENASSPSITVDIAPIFSSLFDASLNRRGGGGGGGPIIPTAQQIESNTTCYEFSVDASGNEVICPITMDHIADREPVMRINRCGHVFKESALRTWFMQNNRCPFCRCSIVQNT